MISNQVLDKIIECATDNELEHLRSQVIEEQRVRAAMASRFVPGHNITQLEDMLIRRGERIQAVVKYRDRVGRGVGIAEAKAAIDAYETHCKRAVRV